jgi:hypothetical protein
MHGENTYPEVVHHCSLGILVASIWTIPGQCHHTWVVETNRLPNTWLTSLCLSCPLKL